MKHQKPTLGVLGLGNMGSAIAKALVKTGFSTHVWNRSAEKSEALVPCGAIAARTVADALAASELVFMCVANFEAADGILSEGIARSALAQRTLVQLSTMSPDEMSSHSALTKRHHAAFLAGGILTYPRGIGAPKAVIAYAGDKEAFERYQPVFMGLAGASQYYGEDVRAAVAAYITAGSYLVGVQSLFYEIAVIARQYGLPLERFLLLTRLISDQCDRAISEGVLKDRAGRYDDSEANIGLLRQFMEEANRMFDKVQAPTDLTRAVIEQLRRVDDRGFGNKDHSQLLNLPWAQNCGSSK